MPVLAHFKGRSNGGYGGALKQLSIGCASSAGKALIHHGGKSEDMTGGVLWKMLESFRGVFQGIDQSSFLSPSTLDASESM